MYTHLTSPPNQSFFLFGVRGVGKSTWAREQFEDAPRFDLLDEGLYRELLANPSPARTDRLRGRQNDVTLSMADLRQCDVVPQARGGKMNDQTADLP